MAGLSLLSLEPNILERVINQIGDRYFHLRLTCRDINDFIRANKRISIRLFKSITASWDEEKSCCLLQCNSMVAKNVEMLFGCRVTSIALDVSLDNHIDQIESILKLNRITSESLDLSNVPARLWTKERCLKMINTVKAINVTLNSRGSIGFEALLESKIPLKAVTVHLNAADVDTALPQLLPRFQNLKIEIADYPDDLYVVLRSLLEIFLAGSFPNLDKFYFEMNSNAPPTKAKMKQELRHYDLTPEYEYDDDDNAAFRFFAVQLPKDFPKKSYCRLIFYPLPHVVFEYCRSGAK